MKRAVTGIQVYRIATTPVPPEVRQTNRTSVCVATDPRFGLVRTRCSQGSPADTVREERDRTSQLDPYLNPRSNPGFQGCARRRRAGNFSNPRLQGLEGSVCVTPLFVDIDCVGVDKTRVYLEGSS